MKALFELMRPGHWVKSLFVLAPMLFSFRFLDPEAVLAVLLTMGAFSLASSAVYSGNDVVDRERDARHPVKRYRPVASGRVSPRVAVVFVAILASVAIALALAVSRNVGAIVAAYLGINIAYTLTLKHVVLVDIMVIAAGFMLRVVAGAVAISVPVSHWMVLVTFFLSLFLGFGKRREELQHAEATTHRSVLAEYTPELVTIYLVIAAVLTIVTYAFYVIDPEVQRRFVASRLLYTVPLVVFGLLRYLLRVVAQGKGGDVADLVLHDRWIQGTVAIWLGVIIWAYQW